MPNTSHLRSNIPHPRSSSPWCFSLLMEKRAHGAALVHGRGTPRGYPGAGKGVAFKVKERDSRTNVTMWIS